MKTIKRFDDIREWGFIRGVDGAEFQVQYQRFLQEAVEIHEAYIENDRKELIDAIGDTIVTLINLAKTVQLNAEDCLDEAFSVIELRKGITKNGSFVRYGKLNEEERKWCDEHQGNPGNEYFKREDLKKLNVKNFTRKEV